MQKSTKKIISQKYDAVYKQCVLKYFVFVKSSENQAEFFELLATYCKKLVENSKCCHVKYLSQSKQKEISPEKLQQDFFRNINKVLWRKNLIDTAYSFGYGRLVTDKIIRTEEKNILEQQPEVLAQEKLWSFLNEIEQIIKREEDFDVILNKLKNLFQLYHLSFIKS